MTNAKVYLVFSFLLNERTNKFVWDAWCIAATSSEEAENIFRVDVCENNNWLEDRKVFISTDREFLCNYVLSGNQFNEVNEEEMDLWLNMHTRPIYEDGDLVEPTFRRIK